jgi:hypothetical protein
MEGYTRGERAWLWAMGVTCAVGVNGAFLYGVIHPEVLREALNNPVAIAFIGEAFMLVAALAWLLRRRDLSRVPWPWFIVLSLVGGLAFALPVALLWRGDPAPERTAGE